MEADTAAAAARSTDCGLDSSSWNEVGVVVGTRFGAGPGSPWLGDSGRSSEMGRA